MRNDLNILNMHTENIINSKDRFKIIGINILLFALLFGLVTLNKEYFRPYFSNSTLAKIITGSFPNFIAAYIISLFTVNPVLIIKPRFGRMIVYISTFIISTILTIEEFTSIGAVSKQYDNYDIIASVLGSILAILTYESIYYRYKNRLNKIETE
jgi:hypothetical protein